MVDKTGGQELACVLGGCTALSHLDLSHTVISRDGAGELAAGLKKCRALVRLDYEAMLD